MQDSAWDEKCDAQRIKQLLDEFVPSLQRSDEALAISRESGIEPEVLLGALMQGQEPASRLPRVK